MLYEKDCRCANKNTQLFLLEVPGMDSEDTVEVEEGILWPGEELTVEDMTPCNSVICSQWGTRISNREGYWIL